MKLSPMREVEHGGKSIPPLSQSRHGDMACESLYTCKHVQGARLGESGAAARGIEIHQVLAAYISHLVTTRRTTDLEVFDGLTRSAGADAQEVLEKFRDNHAFDPEKILATELHIGLDENFLPAEHPCDQAAVATYEGRVVGRLMPRLRHLHRAHFAGKELQSGEKKRRAVQPGIPLPDSGTHERMREHPETIKRAGHCSQVTVQMAGSTGIDGC